MEQQAVGIRGSEASRGHLGEFIDLYLREEHRCRTEFIGQPHDYAYISLVSDDKRVTSVTVFYEGDFVGAGTAIWDGKNAYAKSAGIRLAVSRALRSVGYR